MSGTIVKQAHSAQEVKAEVRQLREAARRIVASKKSAIRFLASTGMYSKNGRLKPQFG